MISYELNLIIERLKTKGVMRFLDGATPEQINQFEEKNKIRFPSKYKEWLQFSDGGECFLPAGVQFYGVVKKPLINVEDEDKPGNNYVVIGTMATGDPILYKKNTEEISIYNQEAGKIEDDERYDDFFLFLEDLENLLGLKE